MKCCESLGCGKPQQRMTPDGWSFCQEHYDAHCALWDEKPEQTEERHLRERQAALDFFMERECKAAKIRALRMPDNVYSRMVRTFPQPVAAPIMVAGRSK